MSLVDLKNIAMNAKLIKSNADLAEVLADPQRLSTLKNPMKMANARTTVDSETSKKILDKVNNLLETDEDLRSWYKTASLAKAEMK